jgi:endonuclease VIII
MPEGDTLYRTAAGLRPYLVGRAVTAARATRPGPQIERVVGSHVDAVESHGKNLVIRFDNGLELRTHMRMNGSWHRYRPGERWRRPPARARVVLEVPGAVAVCFDAPVVELFEQRSESVHPSLSALGPDLLDPAWDEAQLEEAIRRLRDPARASRPIAAALLDQRALAGIGNIWRNETLFAERIDPLSPVASLDDATLRRLVETARRLLVQSAGVAPGRATTYVYRRSGRPCPRCRTLIRSAPLPGDVPRTTYWCPRCQASAAAKEPS